MVGAEGHVHRLDNFETAFFFRRRHKFGLSRTDGKNTRLRRVNDRSEVADAKHPKVRNGEGTALHANKFTSFTQTRYKTQTWYSEGCNLPSLAFLASAFVSADIVAKPLDPASFTIGVIKPLGVATATEISAFL